MLILGQNDGNEEFFEGMGFAGLLKTHSITSTIEPRGIEYLKYLYNLLEEPKRSGIYALNAQTFAGAVMECLSLYLCNRAFFQKRRSRFEPWRARRRRTSPWLWRMRFGPCNIYHRNHPKAGTFDRRRGSRPVASPGLEDYQVALYEWALIVLPFFLENSAVSPDLAEHLSRSTFSINSVRFPYLTRRARLAISTYLLRVKVSQGELPTSSWLVGNP
ncbi:hypothetical protein M413DRAFT_257021 [Hebeloma cylindrosporum]|uniref:Uncharacterized protein n=1 Tax=Hebeloma cylindrosporum TaxID=76867 RepID=A0A0C3C1F3_HEBCY|nr:hypothetical protein M413DRAFT_257021 [Hebeloma cylindrosporum h7]